MSPQHWQLQTAQRATAVECARSLHQKAAFLLEILEGANELQQWIVARRMIGRDVTG